ncbi:hypothetical protein [Shinella sp. M31]|uniref:hypothetical protein n=1 Tax=Shinella sp. M31 TaxID=3368615 RepID=UPI003BA065BD
MTSTTHVKAHERRKPEKTPDPFADKISARLEQMRRHQAKAPQRQSMPSIIEGLRNLAKLMQKVGR